MTREALPTIFLSYAADDAQDVGMVAQWLAARDYDVWFDRKVSAGDEWRRTIVDAINKSSVCIVFLSERSMRSSWVLEEAKLAADQNKLLAIAVGDFSWKSAPRPVWDLANHVTQLETSKAFVSWLGAEVKDRCSSSYRLRSTRRLKHPVFQIAKTPRELARCDDQLAGPASTSTFWIKNTLSDWASKLDRRPMSDDECLYPHEPGDAAKLFFLNSFSPRYSTRLRLVADAIGSSAGVRPFPLSPPSSTPQEAEVFSLFDGGHNEMAIKRLKVVKTDEDEGGLAKGAQIHVVTDPEGEVLGSSSVLETDNGDVLKTQVASSADASPERREKLIVCIGWLIALATLGAHTRGRDLYSFVDPESEDEDFIYERLAWLPVPDQVLDEDLKACRERQLGQAARTLRATASSALRATEWLENSRCVAHSHKVLSDLLVTSVRELSASETEPARRSPAKAKQ